MSNYVTLMGSEDVLRAGRTISEAADTMRSAAHMIDSAVQQNERVLESFLQRFEELVERLEAPKDLEPCAALRCAKCKAITQHKLVEASDSTPRRYLCSDCGQG